MAVSLDALGRNSTPPSAPLHMPRQHLGAVPQGVTFPWQGWRTFVARLVTFGGASALTLYAAREMYYTVSIAGVTSLQWVMLALFVITFGWIALSATGSLAGLFFGRGRYKAAKGAAPQGLTVLLMPVYNEDPSRTFAALYAMGSALCERGLGRNVELFVISDSTDPAKWAQETSTYHALREALAGKMNVWYRRRFDNAGKKAGNVEDFVTQWGARFDYMVVLDADSMMSADAITTLMVEMDADPSCALLQTLPQLQGGHSLFARLQQFAGAVYGPVVARGITAWQASDGNFWGHNAIIRVRAFAEAAGLPILPGKKPFGGAIMSHDFVEASLLRRAGWGLRMLPELHGSWEESPPTLLDMATRDRRWAQGNIQHMAVLKRAKGLRWPNRVHMVIGVLSYLASPLWLLLIAVGVLLTSQTATQRFQYFSEEFQLFPNWPVFDSERMITLFVVTMGVLLFPKLLGFLRACFSAQARKVNGVLALTASVLLETLLSMFYAPVCMLIHSRQVWEIFSGQDSGWEAQQRGRSTVQWKLLFHKHGAHTVTGVLLTLLLYWAAPPLLPWMAPTIVGLITAIPMSALSGSELIAQALRKVHLLRIPEEVAVPEEFLLRDAFATVLQERLAHFKLHDFLADDEALARHCRTLPPPAPAVRGHFDLDKMAVELKLAEAKSIEELLTWLSRKELVALLREPELLARLPRGNEPSPTQLPLKHVAGLR
jgi:membrane glycosyltransferase